MPDKIASWFVLWMFIGAGLFGLVMIAPEESSEAFAAFAGGDGTPGNPYQIATVEQLQAMKDHLDAHFVLVNDIDASVTRGWNGGAGFEPIGTDSHPFTGTFDGRGYKIVGLYINRSSTDYAGLFGYTGSGSEIRNVSLEGISIRGSSEVGGLAGRNAGRITDSYSGGSVNGSDSVGGLVGWNAGRITDSYFTGRVNGSVDVGGLVGQNTGRITDSYSSGSVKGSIDVGGLVGENFWGTIVNSYSGGSVYGSVCVGGLTGYIWGGTITDSYSTSRVNGSVNVGGLTGYIWGGTITNAYSTGRVYGTENVGGLVGGSWGTITNSYWDIQTSGQSTSAGGTGKTTAEMKRQATYVGWNFTSVWGINEGRDYPYLRWQEGPPVITTADVTVAIEDVLYRVDYDATDPTNDTLIWSLSTNASWLSIDYSTGILSGTPANADVGTYWVNVSVTDDNDGVDWHNFTLRVFNVNDAPEIVTVDVTAATEDILYRVDYEAIDIDPTNDTLTWSLQTDASWLSIDSSTGVLSGTPTNADVGTYWVNVSVSDGNGGVDRHNFTLRVFNVNDAPEIVTEDVTAATEDVLYRVDYEAIDVDPTSDILTWRLSTNASWLSIDSSAGILSGTPANADVGTYWVNVSVSDGNGGVDWHNFTLRVFNVNDAPEIVTEDVTAATEDVLYRVDYEAIDVDPTSDILTWRLLTNASWLSIDPSTGILSGMPANADVGVYWVNVSASDGNGGVDWHNFTLRVVNVNDPPVIENAPSEIEVKAGEDYVLDFSGYVYDVDNATGELKLTTDSKYARISGLTIIFNYPATVSWEKVTITVSDGIGTATHTINVSVIGGETEDGGETGDGGEIEEGDTDVTGKSSSFGIPGIILIIIHVGAVLVILFLLMGRKREVVEPELEFEIAAEE